MISLARPAAVLALGTGGGGAGIPKYADAPWAEGREDSPYISCTFRVASLCRFVKSNQVDDSVKNDAAKGGVGCLPNFPPLADVKPAR
ncbi:unnamed protein product [Timema podura]|uniref:Secreted protein n=1 Tax=Timema podura TaxID=61482 RepID=A0ABN7PH48_TIMPD|nr:unnamed protein product [Timema podura]